MPDQMMSSTLPEPYELAAKALFYDLMDWRYGPAWRGSRATYDEQQHQLGELLLAHFRRFETGLQQMIDRLLELNHELAALMPARPPVLTGLDGWQITAKDIIALGMRENPEGYGLPPTTHHPPATGSTALPACPAPDRSPEAAVGAAPDEAEPPARQS